MRLNFSEVSLTYGMMTVPWYIVSVSRWLRYEVNEFLWVLSKHQIMTYVLSFVVGILVILT
jgi:hypothetical protein